MRAHNLDTPNPPFFSFFNLLCIIIRCTENTHLSITNLLSHIVKNRLVRSAPGGMARARSVPGHAASGSSRVSRAEERQAAESPSGQERSPAGRPADILRSSARLPGQDEQRRPRSGNSFTC